MLAYKLRTLVVYKLSAGAATVAAGLPNGGSLRLPVGHLRFFFFYLASLRLPVFHSFNLQPTNIIIPLNELSSSS